MKRRRFDSSWRLSLCNWTIMSHALCPSISLIKEKEGARCEKSIRFFTFSHGNAYFGQSILDPLYIGFHRIPILARLLYSKRAFLAIGHIYTCLGRYRWCSPLIKSINEQLSIRSSFICCCSIRYSSYYI
jgi:hypothetical protein